MRRPHRSEAGTPGRPTGLPGGRSRALAVLGAGLAAGTVGVVAYDAYRIVRLRRDAPQHLVQLDHDGVVGEGLGPVLDLAILGDSAADGYGNGDPRDAYPQQVAARLSVASGRRVRLRSLAVSGASTADVADDQVFQLRASPPDVVVAAVGVNDAIARRRVADVRAATHDLLDRLAAVAPDAVVALVGTPDLSTAPGIPWPLSRLLGWRCRAVARTQEAVARQADIPFVRYGRAPDVEMFGPDGFHPGPAGQAAAADLTVDAIVATEETPWTSD